MGQRCIFDKEDRWTESASDNHEKRHTEENRCKVQESKKQQHSEVETEVDAMDAAFAQAELRKGQKNSGCRLY